MRRWFSCTAVCCVLIMSVLSLCHDVHAIAITGAGISNPGTVDQGGTYSVSYTVSANDSMAADIMISVSGGGVFAGATSTASVNGNMVVLGGVDGVTAVSGTIAFSVVSADPVTISLSGSVTSLNDFTSAPVGASTTIAVRSAEEIAAAQAAAEEAARQAAAQAAAEEAARQAAAQAAAEEAARQAAAQSAVDESVSDELAAEDAEVGSVPMSPLSLSDYLSVTKKRFLKKLSGENAEIRAFLKETRSIHSSEADRLPMRPVKVNGHYYIPVSVCMADHRSSDRMKDDSVCRYYLRDDSVFFYDDREGRLLIPYDRAFMRFFKGRCDEKISFVFDGTLYPDTGR